MSGAGFVNLHNHSHYSILDGYSRPIEYLKRAAALGQPALALTDHGNLFGAFEFVSTARAMSKGLDKKKHPQEPVWVKPIVGIEAYMAPENPEGAKCKRSVYYSDDPSKRSIDVSSNGAYTHLTLLAVDDAGFHNLIRLSTESFKRENMYHKQRMDMSMLAKWNEGLVATTGCPSGEIQTRLRLGQTKEAYEYAERMADLFPGRYYVEIMSHAMKKDLEREAIPKLLKLAEDLKLPLLATNDAHYASPGDARRHEEMLCINTNSRGGAGERVYMDTPTEDTVDEWMEAHQKEAQDYLSRGRRVPTRFAFSGDDYYLKSFDEMIRQFPEDQFPGAVRNSLEIADMVGDWWAKDPLDLEALKTKYGNDVKLAEAGLEFTDDYRLPHAGGGVTREAVKANKGVTVLGSTPEHAVEFKSDPLTQKLIDDGTVALGPYDLSLNKGIRPVIQIPEGWTEDQWFRKKLNDGFVQRRVAKGDSPEILAESKRRLDVEYPVFEGNDFVQYMLVVADYIAWAREHGVTVGSGRGSVGGSEVAYLMDISRTDPIRHDLLFERFLNPERKSPPDVDTDFKASVRNDVLQYAKDKYGYGNVANIVNFGTFKLKQAFQDIAKIYHADSSQAIKMSKMIPDPIDHVEPTMEDLYDPKSPFYPLAEDFRAAIEAGGEQWKPIREAAGALVGRVRQTGTHACGVIMCSEPIVDYAPLFWNSNEARAKENIWTDCMCQWKYQDLEAIGLIKMDFLPLSTLDVVDSVISNVEQYNEAIDSAANAASKAGDAGRAAEYRKRKLEVPDFTDIENDGMSDPETYAMLARGESDAVFQMGSDGQKDLLKRIRPTGIDDLVAINALYRPGPMAMNAHLQYADRKNGVTPAYVVNKELNDAFKGTPVEDVLKLTHGLVVYQEEVQQIAQRLCGYTKGQSDSLRKAMGHKVKSEMIANHKMFVDGAMKTAKEKGYRYTKEDVEKLWDIIEQFSAYAFNKCLLYSTKVLLPDNSKITLRDLHKKWQAGDHEIEIMSMWPDGQIRPNKIVNVERMPEKLMTYTVTVKIPKRYRDRKRSFTTRQITMTSNHRMLTTDGYHTIDDGGIHVGSILINDPLWRSRDTAKRNAIRRDTARKSIGVYARSEEGREMAREWLTRYQAGLTFEDRSAHQKAVQRLHPDRTDASVKAMYEAHVKANQEGRSSGYGIMTLLSDGRLCDSINEARAGEYLLSRGVDFQLHKSIRNDRGQLKFCDFYADGLYFEMDGMGRGEQYFRDNKYGDDVPFVYMTPGDYKDKIDEALMNHHIENGVEVISIEPYHKTEVYDVEMADSGPSNFIANGLVSHNSHSVSYAINAYETAYLKCHYKPFFWAANLTQNMKNKDKFRKFLRSAKDMGLQVASVDVNKSGVGVTAAFDPDSPVTDTITFGFDTASGVNEAVAGEIVRARSANGGSFKSFDDFMTHGPESILSAGAIVGLADAGAFDCLGVKRKQVADRAKWIVDFYKRKRAAVSSSSMGLLGMLGGGSASSTEKSMGEYDLTKSEWSKKEGTISFGPLSYDWGTMLAKEKESLGVYASADPLSNAGYGLEVMKRNPSSPYRAISELEAEARQAQAGPSAASSDGWHRKAATVRVIGYLVDLVVKRNAKGGVWFSGSICDESGSIEFRMYSKAIQQRMSETGLSDPKTVISEDTVYDLTCSWSADSGRLMISDVSEVPMAKADGAVPIIIRMKSEGSLRSAKWRAVASLMDAHPGNVPVAVDLAKSTGSVELDGRPAHRGVNMLGARVDASSEFMDELTRLVGDRLCSWESKAKWDPAY